jgi:hypothetical protein
MNDLIETSSDIMEKKRNVKYVVLAERHRQARIKKKIISS